MIDAIPYVRPDSKAAQAVSEVGDYFATHPDPSFDELEELVKARIIANGGDRVTAAASAATASELARRSPGHEQRIAEQLVGVTLADPSRVGPSVMDNTRAAWKTADLSSEQEKIGIARSQAQQALADAGAIDTASSHLLDTKFQEYIDQGVSPERAAAQAAAVVLAQSAPQSESFSIYGYLTMLVHGNTDYSFNKNERVNIAGSAIHTHFMSTTYNMGGNDFLVDCRKIKTESVGEDVRTHTGKAIGTYESQYLSVAKASISAFQQREKYGTLTKSVAGATLSGNIGRVYLAGFDSDLMLWANSGSANDKRWSVLDAVIAGTLLAFAVSHRFK